jgi:acetolactate synthase I/II/III large subunit
VTTVAKLVIDALKLSGITQLFCLPGVQNDDFFDELVDTRDWLDLIVCRHEQGAAYLAAGAAAATGRPMAMCVVPGPGMFNAAAGLLSAYTANAAVLAIIGQIPSAAMGKGYGVLHEIPDQTAILRQITKHAECITDPARAADQLQAAMDALVSGSPRPVSIEVPVDIWTREASGSLHVPQRTMPVALDGSIEQAAQLLAHAERPMIWVGGGAQDASEAVRSLSRTLLAPVGTRRMGHGVVDERQHSFAPLGMAHELWKQADVVVGIGTRMEWPIMQWGTTGMSIVQINTDADELNRHGITTVGVHGDAAVVVPALEAAIKRVGAPARASHETVHADLAARRAAHNAAIAGLEPQLSFLAAIHDALPDDGIIVEDVTQLTFASHFAYSFTQPRTFLSTGVSGTLGAGVAWGIGAQAALPNRKVLVVTGDGGFMFSATELATAVRHGIPVTVLLMDDGAFGNVKLFQKQRFGAERTIAVDLVNPNFMAFAESFGMLALRANDPAELADVLKQALGHPGPVLVHVPVGEMPSPWPHLLLGKAR